MNSQDYEDDLRNSNFETLYYMVGGCHTALGAWLELNGKRKNIEDELIGCEALAMELMAEEKIARANMAAADTESDAARDVLERSSTKAQAAAVARTELADAEAKKLESMAILRRTGIRARSLCETYSTAQDELRFVVSMLGIVAPIAGNPTCERAAFQDSQREEALGDISKRIENHVLFDGRIPPDLMAEARAHPDFVGHIVPLVTALKTAYQTPEMPMKLLPPIPWMRAEDMEASAALLARRLEKESLPVALAGLLGPGAPD
jgi:hypothetical protein